MVTGNFKNPDWYAGKVVSILNDTQIIGMADSFTEARPKVQQIAAVSSSSDVTYFKVPHSIDQVLIP